MNTLLILGRIIVGGYFVYSGYSHFANLKHLASYAGAKKVPLAKEAVFFTGILMVLGGLSILAWEHVDMGVIALIVFLIPTTLMMHDFWRETDQTAKMESQIAFLKNTAMVGFLLMILGLLK
jgi:uncharacterized membrane protein YphA (DoxX/SURF4 family)